MGLTTTMLYLISSKQKKEMIGLINQNVQMKRMYEEAKQTLERKTEEKNKTIEYFDTKEYERTVTEPLQEFLKFNPSATLKEKAAKKEELYAHYKATKESLLELYEYDFQRDTNLYRQIVRDQESRQERINRIKKNLKLNKADEEYCTLSKDDLKFYNGGKELTK